MKDNGIVLDYEWAYNKVMRSYDFTGKSPEWIESFIDGWMEGYLEGFLKGRTEGTIRVICWMKQAGMASDKIAAYTDVATGIVEMLSFKKEP